MKKLLAAVLFSVNIFIFGQVADSVQISPQEPKADVKKDIDPIKKDDSALRIKEIKITGTDKYSKNQIMRYTGLYEGDFVEIPGMQINTAVKKLWDSKLFANVEIFLTKVINKEVYLRINLVALPDLGTVKFHGISKSKGEKLIKENGLKT